MKRIKTMRIASVLLVFVLLTTCVVSGTFAKYVTSGEASDSVSVAKWGVTISANTGTTITTTEVGGANEEHITSSTGSVKLAPGSEVKTLADLTISGTPEVAVNVNYVAELTLNNWTIDTDTYYCPLEFDVNGTIIKGTDFISKDVLESKVEAAIHALSNNYETNQDLSSVLAPQVTVRWAFEGNNENDTKLGDLETLPSLSLTVTATVTQID